MPIVYWRVITQMSPLPSFHPSLLPVTPSLLSSLSPPFPLRYPSPLPSFPLSSLPPSLPIPPPILPSQVCPEDHKAADFDFDVLVGADGRRSTIPGFDRKELRGKLALAITANFVNYYSREEAAVDEISGVAFIFNQKFFKVVYSVSCRVCRQ